MIEQKIMNEIIGLYYSYDKTKDYYEKSYIIYTFNYLHELMPQNDILSHMCDSIRSKAQKESFYLQKGEENITNMMQKFIADNKDFNNQNIPSEYEITVCPYAKLAELDESNVLYIFGSFLRTLGYDIYDFYQEMLNDGRIIIGSDSRIAFTSLNNSNTIIFHKQENTMRDVLNLVHEFGHAYYISVNNQKVGERGNIKTEIKDEIPAKIMEVRFIKFLRDNMVIEPSLILQNEYDKKMVSYSEKRDEYSYLKYLIASYIAVNLGDDVDITKYFKKIYKKDYQDLLTEINNKIKNGKVFKK